MEAFELECPDDELKADVLEEFIHVDHKYMEKMGELEKRHKSALGYGLLNTIKINHSSYTGILNRGKYSICD